LVDRDQQKRKPVLRWSRSNLLKMLGGVAATKLACGSGRHQFNIAGISYRGF